MRPLTAGSGSCFGGGGGRAEPLIALMLRALVCSSRLAARTTSGDVEGFLGTPFAGFEPGFEGVGAAGL